jgi:hypothetical protein
MFTQAISVNEGVVAYRAECGLGELTDRWKRKPLRGEMAFRPRIANTTEGPLMLKLSLHTWVRNAASVFSGRHGSVTQQADQSLCSRQTVYQHARKLQQHLSEKPQPDALIARLRLENQQLRQTIAEQLHHAEERVLFDKTMLRRFATIAFAIGLSLRQIEELLAVLLPRSKAPDHSTLGRWVQSQAERAANVLAVIDTACADRVRTLAVDEIFFGGDRPWSPSNRRA